MGSAVTSTYAPDALRSLRDSFSLHLDATRADKTARIYLSALDALIVHLDANGMPTCTRGVRREHIESWFASRRDVVRPTTLSVEFRALQQFWRAVEEEEVDRSGSRCRSSADSAVSDTRSSPMQTSGSSRAVPPT